MMVSFLKSSHGLAPQRRSGRVDRMTSKYCAKRNICKRNDNASVTILLMMVMAAVANCFDANKYYTDNPTCLGSSSKVVEVNQDSDPFSGLWVCVGRSMTWSFQIDRRDDLVYKANFTNSRSRYPKKPLLSANRDDSKAFVSEVVKDKCSTLNVLCVEQNNEHWLITPQDDDTLFIWTTLKENGFSFTRREGFNITKEFLTLGQDMVVALAPKIRKLDDSLKQPKSGCEAAQRLYEAIRNKELCCISEENATGSDATGSTNCGTISDLEQVAPKVDDSERGSWFCTIKRCPKQKYWIDEKENIVYLDKVSGKGQFGATRATLNWPTEIKCYACHSPRPKESFVLTKTLEKTISSRGKPKASKAEVKKMPTDLALALRKP